MTVNEPLFCMIRASKTSRTIFLWIISAGLGLPVVMGGPVPYLPLIGPGPIRFQQLPQPVTPAVVPLPPETAERAAGETAATNAVPWTEILAAIREDTNVGPVPSGELGAVTNRIASGRAAVAGVAPVFGGESTNGVVTPQAFLEIFQQRFPMTTNSQTIVLLPVEFVPPQPFEPPPSSKATFTTPKEN